MAKSRNYLRSNRRRLELSLGEVAFLLGSNDAPMISKHELHSIEANLKTALAYEVIYGRPVRELFAGFYQQVEKDVAARAKILTHRLDRGRSMPRSLRRRQAFNELAALQSSKPITNNENDRQ